MNAFTVQHDELPLLGEPFAVDLANSAFGGDDHDLDCLGSAAAVATWVAAAPGADDLAVPRALPEADLATLRDVRDATRRLLGELADGTRPLSQEAASVLHEASRRAPAHLALDLEGEAPAWDLHVDGAAGDVLVASAAARCILFLGGDDAGRVRRCARPACPMLFVQHHRARRFCSEFCSHRVRQARYHRARRGSR